MFTIYKDVYDSILQFSCNIFNISFPLLFLLFYHGKIFIYAKLFTDPK